MKTNISIFRVHFRFQSIFIFISVSFQGSEGFRHFHSFSFSVDFFIFRVHFRFQSIFIFISVSLQGSEGFRHFHSFSFSFSVDFHVSESIFSSFIDSDAFLNGFHVVSLVFFQIFDAFSNVLIDFQAVASSYFHFAKSVSSIIFQVLGYIFRRFQILIFFYQCFSSFHSLSHIFASIFRSCNNLKCFIRQFFEWSLVHAKTTDTILLYLGCLLPYHGSGGWWFWDHEPKDGGLCGDGWVWRRI